MTEEIAKEICNHYINRTLNIVTICATYNLTSPKLYKIFRKNNIELHGNGLPSEKVSALIQLYATNKTIKECCDELHISKSVACKWLKIKNIKIHPRGQFLKKYIINEDFFSNIDTFEKAQILGLIYADGTLNPHTKATTIRLVESDSAYLEKIKEVMNINKPLSLVPARSFIGYTTGKPYLGENSVSLDLTNVKIYKDLMALGLCPRKTYANLGVPDIPKQLRRAFILGLFEGDGCSSFSFVKNSKTKIHSCIWSIACQERMATDLQKIIFEETEILPNIYNRKSIFILSLTNRHSIQKIYHWLYGNSSFTLERKKIKLENFISLIDKKVI